LMPCRSRRGEAKHARRHLLENAVLAEAEEVPVGDAGRMRLLAGEERELGGCDRADLRELLVVRHCFLRVEVTTRGSAEGRWTTVPTRSSLRNDVAIAIKLQNRTVYGRLCNLMAQGAAAQSMASVASSARWWSAVPAATDAV